MMNRKQKKRRQDDLDTETTFADMNVEGFRWYRPKGKQAMPELSREESRAMLQGAIAALWPVLLGAVAILLVLVGLAYLWLS